MEITVRDKVYATRVETDGDIVYIGEAAIGSDESDSVWRIQRVDNSGPVEITWAGGGAFTSAWDDRATLTYN